MYEDIVDAYATLGGIPRYAQEFDSRKSFHENILNDLVPPNDNGIIRWLYYCSIFELRII